MQPHNGTRNAKPHSLETYSCVMFFWNQPFHPTTAFESFAPLEQVYKNGAVEPEPVSRERMTGCSHWL
jgi:hypothetical protein